MSGDLIAILKTFRFESWWLLPVFLVIPLWIWLRGQVSPAAAVEFSSGDLLRLDVDLRVLEGGWKEFVPAEFQIGIGFVIGDGHGLEWAGTGGPRLGKYRDLGGELARGRPGRRAALRRSGAHGRGFQGAEREEGEAAPECAPSH